ncbi:hypothetical protein [Variovorax sp. GT1P44]|uniref:hypothetical protein n=1 Tax=Variovorax sp. GT1P44 TaxID=3443742 RepID=UPI003F47C3F6
MVVEAERKVDAHEKAPASGAFQDFVRMTVINREAISGEGASRSSAAARMNAGLCMPRQTPIPTDIPTAQRRCALSG